MSRPSHATGSSVVASLQETLLKENLEELHQYITEGTHLDLSTAWSSAVQSNDSTSSTAIVKAISQILIKIDGENGFISPGSAFIRRTLSEHTRSILRNLSSLRPLYVNPTLRMLITMAQFDAGALSNDVYISLDFATFKVLPKLLTRSGPQTQKPKDDKLNLGKRKRDDSASRDATRGLFTGLLFTLLNRASSSTKSEIIQRGPIMQELIKFLSSDSEESVIKTLKGFITIISNREIPRPAKVQCFNESTLAQLRLLYSYETIGTENGEIEDTVMEDESSSRANPIRNLIHSFFVAATTLPDNGLCFTSKGLLPPANKKLYNPILGSFILSLDPEDELQADLLVEILKGTPELISHWAQNTKIDFSPRLDAKWIGLMQIFEHIVNGTLPENTLSNIDQIPDFVFTEYILPSPLAKIATKGLQHESGIVKLMTCRTLVKCLSTLRALDKDNDRLVDLAEQIQRNAPLIETIMPLATIGIKDASEESDALLRQEAIILLELYVSSFSNIPNFDFVKLFETILSSRPIDRSELYGEDEEEDEIMLSDQDNTRVEVDVCLTSIEEQRAILRMANHIPGLPWLAKRGNSHSMLYTVLRFMCFAHPNESGAAAEMLWKIITADSIALNDKGLSASSPVCKLVAFVLAIESSDSEQSFSPRRDDILNFIEHCMIKFQAAPYKYWDMLTELCATHNLDMNCDFSLILLTMKEQLPFFEDKAHIGCWFERLLMHLVSIGEDQAVADIVLGRPVRATTFTREETLWNGVRVAFALFRNVPVENELDPEETYPDGSDSEEELEWEVGDSWSSLHWMTLMAVLETLHGEDRQQFQDFLLELWTSQSNINNSQASEMLNVLARHFHRVADRKPNNKLYDVVERLIPLASGTADDLYPLLDSDQIRMLAENSIARSQKLTPDMKGALLEGFTADNPEIHAHANTALFLRLITPADLQHRYVLKALTKALARRALDGISLEKYLCIPDADLPRESMLDIAEIYRTESMDIAQCIATYVRKYSPVEIPTSFLNWTKLAPFETAAVVISELLSSSSQEIRESGYQALEVQNDIGQLLDIFKTPSDAVLRCIRERVKQSPAVQNQWIRIALAKAHISKWNGSNNFELLAALGTGNCSLPDDSSEALSTYHIDLVKYLTRQFAENRIQEKKFLGTTLLGNVKQLVHYIANSPRFAGDVGKPMLDTMVSAAIENQSHHTEVLKLLTSIVQSTASEAFNYAKTIQALFSEQLISDTDKVKLATLELLHALILHDPQKANLNVLDELLKIYNGTLSQLDMLCFDVFCKLESTLNVSIGSRMQSWRVVTSIKDHTVDHRKVDAVLAGDRARTTMFHFLEYDMVDQPDQVSDVLSINSYDQYFMSESEEDDEMSETKPDNLYDLRFMLPLIAGFIHADPSISMLKQLLQNHAAGLAFLGLASNHVSIRQRASQVLARLDAVLQSSTIREKAQLSTIFQIVKNSITTTTLQTSPIPLIHAVFLGLAVDVMMEPAHFLYEKMNRFILARPQIDFDDIPMFLNLFNSHESYGRHVVWILSLLRAGLRGHRDGDARGYGRRHVLEMCMGLYGSRTASPAMKDGIRELLRLAMDGGDIQHYFERVGGPAWIKMSGDEDLMRESS